MIVFRIHTAFCRFTYSSIMAWQKRLGKESVAHEGMPFDFTKYEKTLLITLTSAYWFFKISMILLLKGSMALHEYLGWEAGFTLEKESQTLALVLKESLIVFAFDNRETLMRWQVRSFWLFYIQLENQRMISFSILFFCLSSVLSI